MLWIRVPRRHAAVANDFGDRVAPARDLAVRGQRERRYLAVAMAADAMRVEDGRDVLGVGYVAGRRLVAETANVAADRVRYGLRHGLAGDDFVDGIDQIGRRLFAAGIADAELIVDSSPIADHPVFVEDECLRCADSAELVRHTVTGIL